MQRDRAAADGLGQSLGPGQGAVGAAELGAGGRGGPGGQTGHGPRADDEHPATGQIAVLGGQQLVRRTDQGAAGDPIPVSVCTRLPTRIACWNREFSTVPTVPWVWQGQRVLDLPEDLVLPHHHRVEPAGDGERVGDGAFVEVDPTHGLQLGHGQSGEIGEGLGRVVEGAVEAGLTDVYSSVRLQVDNTTASSTCSEETS